ncbi:hypothetical protein E8E11_000342 [Didymella keratinophila]|nr:hypothetical protein E8E11_000342 [Didymella keratinophila]
MWEPFGEAPANSTAYWQSGPKERGTLSIMSTCILTLLLCAYTSLHMNIPEYGQDSLFEYLKLRVLWVHGAPEVVAFIAFRQWLFARNFRTEMNKLLFPEGKGPSDIENQAATSTNQTNSKKGKERKHEWTEVHSHFALMGGFAFDTHTSDIKFLPGDRESLTLTTHALRKLATFELISSQISRKRPSRTRVRPTVLGRLAASSPISLLEMNTLLHALCSLVIYLAWWDKPLGIGEPFPIETKTLRCRQICAWMVMESEVGFKESLADSTGAILVYDEDIHRKDTKKRHAELQRFLREATDGRTKLGMTEDVHVDRVLPQQEVALNDDSMLVQMHLGQKLLGFRLLYLFAWSDFKANVTIRPKDVECLRLANSLRQEPGGSNDWKSSWTAGLRLKEISLLVPQVPVTSSMDDDTLSKFEGSTWFTRQFNNAQVVYWSTLALAGSVYGLVHLLAWDGPFPTQAERWL